MYTVKTFELTKDGKRNTKACNHIRAQMFNKIREIVEEAGFETAIAANKDLAIPVAIDSTTGETYYARITLTFSSKELDSKPAPKAKKPAMDEVELPELF